VVALANEERRQAAMARSRERERGEGEREAKCERVSLLGHSWAFIDGGNRRAVATRS
jgi:hypothetical protein